MDEHNSGEEQFYNNSPITFDDFNNLSSVNESSDEQTASNQMNTRQDNNLSTQFNPVIQSTSRDQQEFNNSQHIVNDQYLAQQQQQFQPVIDEDMFQQYNTNESIQSNPKSIQQAQLAEKKRSLLSSNQVLNEKIQEQLSKIEGRQFSQQNNNWNPIEVFTKKQSLKVDHNQEFEQQIIQEQGRERVEKFVQDPLQKKSSNDVGSQNEIKSASSIQNRKLSNQELFQAKNKTEQLNELEQQIQRYQEIQHQLEKKKKSTSLKSQSLIQNSESDSQKSISSTNNNGLQQDPEKIKVQSQYIERKSISNNINTQQQAQLQLQQQQQINQQQQLLQMQMHQQILQQQQDLQQKQLLQQFQLPQQEEQEEQEEYQLQHQYSQQLQQHQQQQQMQIQSSRQENNSYINVDYNTVQVDKKQIEQNTTKFKMQWESVLSDSKLTNDVKKFNNGQKSIEKQLKQLENQQNIYKQLIQSQQQHELDEKKYYSKHIEDICNQLGIDRSNSLSPAKLEQIKQKLIFTNNNNSNNISSNNNSSSKKLNYQQYQQQSARQKDGLFQQIINEGKSDGKDQKTFTFSHNQPTDNGPFFLADMNNNSSNFQQNNVKINDQTNLLNNQQQQNIIEEQIPDRKMMEKIEKIDNQFSLSNERPDFNQSNYLQNNQDDNVLLQNSDLVNSNLQYQNHENASQVQQQQQELQINLQCPLHPDEINLFFCGTCKQFNICLICLHAGLHQNHFIVDLQQEAKNCNNQNSNSFFLHKLFNFVSSLKERKNQLLSKQDVITQKQKRIMNQQDEIILFAQNKLQEIRNNVDNFEKKIHNDINKVFTHWYESFCADQDKLQEIADELQNECDYFESAFSQQQNSLLQSNIDNSQIIIPIPIQIYANHIDKIEAILTQEDNPIYKNQDLNVSSLENNLTERNNMELQQIVESLKNLSRKVSKSLNKLDKPTYLDSQSAYNQKHQFESIQQHNRSKSPQQLDTFRKSPIQLSKQQNYNNRSKNQLSERAQAIQEQFYSHMYPTPLQNKQNNNDHFRSEDHHVEEHFISYSPSRLEGQNNSQHSLSVNSMFGKSTSTTNNNQNIFQSTSILAKHNQSLKHFESHSHRKSLSHRKLEINNPLLTRNYETLQRIKQNIDQLSLSPHSSQKKISLVNASSLFNQIANTNGLSLNNGSILKNNQNNENLTSKFFSNAANISQIPNNNASIGQNSKRQSLRSRKSDIDLTSMKGAYEDFKSSNKFFNNLIPSSTQSQIQRSSPKRVSRVDNQLATHRNHQNSLQKNNPITIDQQHSCSKMMSNLIKYKQLYNKGKRSFFDQSSNGGGEQSNSNNFN